MAFGVDDPGEHLSDSLIEQYIIAGLPQSDAEKVHNHLANCSSCHCRFETLEFWAGFCGSEPRNKGRMG